ncbi:cupin domain-containing protein [Aminithiophilus ramosus]|uniref:Cupin domain-containing protein n=1 Tax=Aminithiophilus ramosus TaxID=3029084 RepID=A0A9Q7APS1_9BACT|nr:cupin domain-containing protein [Aminithiophilus ramosus]QTX33262.1 cupin domain-containing protein [Aminithiophilus ramosus]
MKVTSYEEAAPLQTPHGVSVCKLYDNPDAQVMHITLEAGESLKRHVTPVDVFFYVLQGTGTVEIGDEKRSVGPDRLVESPKDIPHCWRNEGDEPFRVLVVKTPRPAASARLL